MLYVSCCKVVLIIQDILMFVFGPLTEIVIIITILIQCLFFFCVFNHSYSTDKVLVIIIHRAYHASRIYPNSFDYAAYFCGSSIGSIIIPIPHYCDLCGLCLGFTCINIGHNFVKHGQLIIFSWPNIIASVY